MKNENEKKNFFVHDNLSRLE